MICIQWVIDILMFFLSNLMVWRAKSFDKPLEGADKYETVHNKSLMTAKAEH